LGAFELADKEPVDLFETFENWTEDLPDLPSLSEGAHRRFHVRRIARRRIRNQFIVLSF
jgi:hypothetical protein